MSLCLCCSQVKYLHLRRNTVSSASFSSDGKLIVTGEIGYRPAVRVWKVRDGQEIATLYGHEFGIKSVLFCPSMEVIISVGLEHDNEVNVWAWPEQHRLATNKIVDVIMAVTYSECGSYFITAGTRHLKFWYPRLTLSNVYQTSIPIVQPLYGRPGILGDCKQHTFIDVACGNGVSASLVYAITRAGSLIMLEAMDRHLKCHKNIDQFQATSLMVQDQILFIGFSSGDIHMFNSLSLLHLAALPVPTFFRRTGLDGGGVFALIFNPKTSLLTTAYQNSSMCIWDLQDADNVKQKYVAVYHSRAIASFDIFTSMDPGGRVRETLVTVSHDSTVRMWGIVIANSICYDRLSILYTDASTPLRPESVENFLDNAGMITAVRVSPDRTHIVTGNKAGNICVYDRNTYEHTLTVMAHNREVTCLAFYRHHCGRTVLVSGSRDRLIHIMDVNNGFRLVNTLSIHSSSITVLSICEANGHICMISCAADRTLSICTAPNPNCVRCRRPPFFHLSRCSTSVSTPSDIAVDLNTGHMAVGCQDGYIRVFDIAMLQERRVFPGCSSEEGQIQKICLDSPGILLLTAASDRTINIINFFAGEILITISGHSKCVTGLTFTSGGDHVISTSMDGCVFIWRLSQKLLQKRQEMCYILHAKRIRSSEELDLSFLLTLLSKESFQQLHENSCPDFREDIVARRPVGDMSNVSPRRRKGGSLERRVALKTFRRNSFSALGPVSSTERQAIRSAGMAARASRSKRLAENVIDLKLAEGEQQPNYTWNKHGEDGRTLGQALECQKKHAGGFGSGFRVPRFSSCIQQKKTLPKPFTRHGSEHACISSSLQSQDPSFHQHTSEDITDNACLRVLTVQMEGKIIKRSEKKQFICNDEYHVDYGTTDPCTDNHDKEIDPHQQPCHSGQNSPMKRQAAKYSQANAAPSLNTWNSQTDTSADPRFRHQTEKAGNRPVFLSRAPMTSTKDNCVADRRMHHDVVAVRHGKGSVLQHQQSGCSAGQHSHSQTANKNLTTGQHSTLVTPKLSKKSSPVPTCCQNHAGTTSDLHCLLDATFLNNNSINAFAESLMQISSCVCEHWTKQKVSLSSSDVTDLSDLCDFRDPWRGDHRHFCCPKRSSSFPLSGQEDQEILTTSSLSSPCYCRGDSPPIHLVDEQIATLRNVQTSCQLDTTDLSGAKT